MSEELQVFWGCSPVLGFPQRWVLGFRSWFGGSERAGGFGEKKRVLGSLGLGFLGGQALVLGSLRTPTFWGFSTGFWGPRRALGFGVRGELGGFG